MKSLVFILLFSIIFFSITPLAYGVSHPSVVIVPNSVTFGEGVRIYLVNSIITVPPQQPFKVGEEINFSWGVQNTGTVTLTNVIVTSDLGTGVSNFHSPDCTISGSKVTCLIPDLAPGERYPVNGFFDFFVTIEPELADTFYINIGKVCGQYQDIIYCTTDGATIKIDATLDPITCSDGFTLVDGICVSVIQLIDLTTLSQRIINLETKEMEQQLRIIALENASVDLSGLTALTDRVTILESTVNVIQQWIIAFQTAWRSVFG